MPIKEVNNEEVNWPKEALKILKVCQWSNPYIFTVLATVGTNRSRLTQWHTTHTAIVLQFYNTLTRCNHYRYCLYIHTCIACCLISRSSSFSLVIRYLILQVFAAIAVSTGCLSYGICMAYTSSAIPSMMEPDSALNISDNEASWMSKLFYNIFKSDVYIVIPGHLMF